MNRDCWSVVTTNLGIMFDEKKSLEEKLLSTFRALQIAYFNAGQAALEDSPVQTVIEAFSYMFFMYLYPADGQFDYYDVVTVKQEALVYACLKVAIDEHAEELKGITEADNKEDGSVKEDGPSKVYRLSLQIKNGIKADRAALRGDPNKDSILIYFRKVRRQKFGEWKIFDEKVAKKAGLFYDEQGGSGDEAAFEERVQ